MNIIALTLLILQINKLIDSGTCSNVTIKDVHNEIENRNCLEFLRNIGGSNIDLSVHFSKVYGDFKSFYEEQIYRIYQAYSGDERKKWGVQNSGLCLLLAWTTEIIAQGGDNDRFKLTYED